MFLFWILESTSFLILPLPCFPQSVPYVTRATPSGLSSGIPVIHLHQNLSI